jgi:hypothetical protein
MFHCWYDKSGLILTLSHRDRTHVVYNSTRTNLCVHIRFKNRDAGALETREGIECANVNMLGVVYGQVALKARLTSLLKDANNNMMFSTDIMAAMVRECVEQCVIRCLVNSFCVQRALI